MYMCPSATSNQPVLPREVRVHPGGPRSGAPAAAGTDPYSHALHENCEWIVATMVSS